MRPDMAKVVTERPRSGHGNDSQKTGKRLTASEIDLMLDDEDSGPARHPVSRKRQYGSEAKGFTDLLGPLQAYLKKQVGRPWNAVYSELSANLDRRSLTGQHIWSHVFWEVETNAILRDGVITKFPHARWANREFIPVEGLYVHPVTGLLSWAKKQTKKERRARYTQNKPEPDELKITDNHYLVRHDGIWYHSTYHIEVDSKPIYPNCLTCGKYYTWHGQSWGVTDHAWVGKVQYEVTERRVRDRTRQMNSKELKTYELVNTPVIKKVSRRKLLR